MSQETNLNVSPYFDDFDLNKDYYKVLFRPGYPIQARELTTLQSILQNQIEQYGKNIFKDGSVVIPGQFKYEDSLHAVEIEPFFSGSPISLYFNLLLGKKIRGSVSGVSAEIVYLLTDTESDRGNYTLYLKYLESGGADFSNKTFQDSETLTLETPISYSNFSLQIGQGICNTIASNSVSKGTAVSVSEGIYFIRGFFARVESQFILLDQYSTSPSYKVGFNIVEEIVTADEDFSLFDNAQGFSNYASSGADRFRIRLELAKKIIEDLEVGNFSEILRIENGIPQFFNKNPQYNLLKNELAKRTFDESGNYFVRPFSLVVRDSLNDKVSLSGAYFKDQKTIQGNTPSEELMIYQISPGKAYVNGYDVETISPRLLDTFKPRTTDTTENEVISFNAGNLVRVNNCLGIPYIGLGTDSVVSLMDSRIGSNATVASGTTIGVARVYDFIPESNYVDDSSTMNLRLFDIQTFTKVGLTTSLDYNLNTPCFIEGKRSGASGYLKTSISAGSTTILTLYETSGKFLENERIIINGIDNGRLIKSVVDYSVSDIKSVYSEVGIATFNADLVLDKKSYLANPGTEFNIDNGVVSVGFENNFIGLVKINDIVSYSDTTFNENTIYNKVISVGLGGTNFTIAGITTVNGVCDGRLRTGSFKVNNIVKINSKIDSNDSSLLTKLNDENVSSINLQGNEIIQRRVYDVSSISGNSITIPIDPLDADIYFDSFDEDKFSITYSDGSFELMRVDKYSLSNNGKSLTFNGLNPGLNTSAKVIVTVKNLNLNSKNKNLNKASSITIINSKLSSSGIGTTTLNDGLSYSQVYGTRVQDKQISLNVPDVVKVLAIFESSSISDPTLPIIQVEGGNSNYVVGENIEGEFTNSIGIITRKIDIDKIEFVYLNETKFKEGEVVSGSTSKEKSIILTSLFGDKNITKNFILDDGQRDTIYDFSRIVRKPDAEEPKRKLKIIFQNYTINSNDTGEIISVNSYSADNFGSNIPSYKGSRVTNYIDIRPRVAPYTLSSKSPFEFDSRNFASDGQYSKYILAPEQYLVLNYSYYLGRIDRIFLNSDGIFEVVQGIPSTNPLPPPLKSNSLDIATVYVPPYVYNVKDVNIDTSKHRRYRMSDIALLEDRIERVEKYTTLSLLESKTENFKITDSETGLDRFKCGFFVDNFSSYDYHDLQNPIYRSLVDSSQNTLRPLRNVKSINLQLGSELIEGFTQTYEPNADPSYVSDLGSPNIKKTGDLITLNYTEESYLEQPYATKTESVTPFLVRYWNGNITLNPSTDNWSVSLSPNDADSNINLRSQNIEFFINSLKPRTRFYPFFQGIDVSQYVIPKLLEIEMIEGTFAVGDNVSTLSLSNNNSSNITFRLCLPNHVSGEFNSPTETFNYNPYDQSPINNAYTESSTFLNVDTTSLASRTQTYNGSVEIGMILTNSSGARARVTGIRLVSDNSGRLIGSLFIPNPNIIGNPTWPNGGNRFLVVDTPNLNGSESSSTIYESSAEKDFVSSVVVEVIQTPTPTPTPTQIPTTIVADSVSNNTDILSTRPPDTSTEQFVVNNNPQTNGFFRRDPLAQSFSITDNTGVFLTSVDIFFETKDDIVPVTLQIRPIISGVPSNEIVPFSEVTLHPDNVQLSVDASIPTRFTFKSPVYLPGPQQLEVRNSLEGSERISEFAIVILSDSTRYRVFISESGSTNIEDNSTTPIQPSLGSLFKSQNGSTWTPSQYEDLKYKIYRADFVDNASLRFFNSKIPLREENITIIGSNQFVPLSKKVVVGLGSTGYDSNGIQNGVTIVQSTSNANGKLIGIGSSIKNLIISNSGFGYTNGTFSEVPLISETGVGAGAKATLVISNSTVSTVTITSGGYGYLNGDSLIIPEKEYGLNVGFGAQFTVSEVSNKGNSFILDNVQGTFIVGINTINYRDLSGVLVSTGATVNSITNDPYYDGLHMKIFHPNHSMHSAENYVEISKVLPIQSDVRSNLSFPITADDLTIFLDSVVEFGTFEGLPVSTENPGYLIVNGEIIKYTQININQNTITATERNVDLKLGESVSHTEGSLIYKYEFNGISLRRINKIHNFAEVDSENHPINLNSYYIKIDTSDTDFDNQLIGTNRENNLYFSQTEQIGEPGSVITNNIQFESIRPNISHFIPAKTNLSCKVRTFTGTSIGGNEKSFVDTGFKNISLTGTTDFDAPRLICSNVNEQKFITESPGSKSFTMEFLLSTTDSRVSPVIDLINTKAVLSTNLINSPSGVNEASTYLDDDSVRGLVSDKHSAIYVSKPINLAISANSIKVLLSASHTVENDIRVLYRIFRADSPELSQNYELFPGFKNYDVDGQNVRRVIDRSKNDGSSDYKALISSERSFRDYEYTIEDLPDFSAFSIKIVMASTNQAIPPLIKELRAIATKKPSVTGVNWYGLYKS